MSARIFRHGGRPLRPRAAQQSSAAREVPLTERSSARKNPLMPAASETTFVVQGPIYTSPPYSTAACLTSIRRHFPGSRIVLSTWAGSACEGLEPDELVLNVDPGAPFGYHVPGHRHDRPNSLNRMLLSTRGGLEASTTAYSVKVRTDFVFTLGTLLRQYDIQHAAFPRRQREWMVFEDKILSSNLYCVDTNKQPFAYHISDLLHVGRTEDLRRLWDVPLMPIEEMTYCFDHDLRGHEYELASRYCSEQWLWLQCLSRSGLRCEVPRHYYDANAAICRDATSLLLSNFLVIDYRDCGVTSKFDSARGFRGRCWTYPAFVMRYTRDVQGRSLPDRATSRRRWDFGRTIRRGSGCATCITAQRRHGSACVASPSTSRPSCVRRRWCRAMAVCHAGS